MTRNDLPKPVDPTTDAIEKSMVDLEADLRRLGLGIQADRAKATLHAFRTLGVVVRWNPSVSFASPND